MRENQSAADKKKFVKTNIANKKFTVRQDESVELEESVGGSERAMCVGLQFSHTSLPAPPARRA